MPLRGAFVPYKYKHIQAASRIKQKVIAFVCQEDYIVVFNGNLSDTLYSHTHNTGRKRTVDVPDRQQQYCRYASKDEDESTTTTKTAIAVRRTDNGMRKAA